MVLCFVKDLALEDATKLRKAINNITFIEKKLDSSPLFLERSNCTDSKLLGTYKLTYMDEIYEKLSSFLLTNAYTKIDNEDNTITRSKTKTPILQESYIQMQVGFEKDDRSYFSFQVGENHGFSGGPNEFWIKKDKTNLSKIIKYFSDKRVWYEEVYKYLLQKHTFFAKAGGEEFADALISSFSVEQKDKKIDDFNLSSEYKRKTMIYSGYKKELLNQKLNKLSAPFGLSYSHEKTISEMRQVKLHLNKDNELEVHVSFSDRIMEDKYGVISSNNIEDVMNNPIYEKTINTDLQSWLKDIVSMSDFASDIYQKISTQDLQKRL